jgi:hypothetical protein
LLFAWGRLSLWSMSPSIEMTGVHHHTELHSLFNSLPWKLKARRSQATRPWVFSWFWWSLSWGFYLLIFVLEIGSCCVAQAVLKLLILLPHSAFWVARIIFTSHHTWHFTTEFWRELRAMHWEPPL